jgi:hypothetical protein
MRAKRRSLYLVAWAVALALMMAPEVGHAQIDEALTIQPIEVCDPSGGCATPSFDFGTMQQVPTSVWAQAGIAPVLLSPETLRMPIPTGQTGAMQVGLTTGADNIIRSPDGFRLLTRTAGNDQSTNPNTINLYIVNTLSPFVNGVPQSNQIVRGISFINGNGIVVGSDAVLDTAAHELGHVLGLVAGEQRRVADRQDRRKSAPDARSRLLGHAEHLLRHGSEIGPLSVDPM